MSTRILLLGTALFCFQNANVMAMDEDPLAREERWTALAKKEYLEAKATPETSPEKVKELKACYKMHKTDVSNLKIRQVISKISFEYGDKYSCRLDAIITDHDNQMPPYIESYIQHLNARKEKIQQRTGKHTPEDNAQKVEKLNGKLQRANEALQGDKSVQYNFILKRLEEISNRLFRLGSKHLTLHYSATQRKLMNNSKDNS
jgi:hypothetical protein